MVVRDLKKKWKLGLRVPSFSIIDLVAAGTGGQGGGIGRKELISTAKFCSTAT